METWWNKNDGNIDEHGGSSRRMDQNAGVLTCFYGLQHGAKNTGYSSTCGFNHWGCSAKKKWMCSSKPGSPASMKLAANAQRFSTLSWNAKRFAHKDWHFTCNDFELEPRNDGC